MEFIHIFSYFILQFQLQQNRKMIEKQSPRPTRQTRYGISTVSSKQNRHTVSPNRSPPKSPVRIIKTASIHLQQAQRTSNSHIFPQRATSPNFYVPSPSVISGRTQIIDIGGREIRQVHKDTTQFQEITRINHSTNDSIRKICMLQARIKELHIEKQIIVLELSEKIKKLQIENDRLNAELQKCQDKSSLIKDNHKIQGSQFDSDTIQEMLSVQININLELREQYEKISQENIKLTEKITQWQLKFKASEAQKNDLIRIHKETLAVQKKQKEIGLDRQKALEGRLNQLQELKTKRTSAIEALIQQKQKRILQLQEEAYQKKSSIELIQKEIGVLEEDLSSEKLDNAQLRQQIQSLKTKITQMESQQCKKCKDLLHTLFRLNSQLNKK